MFAVALLALTLAQARGIRPGEKHTLINEKYTLAWVECFAPGVILKAKPGISIDEDALTTQMELALRRSNIPVCSKSKEGVNEGAGREWWQLSILGLFVTVLHSQGHAAGWQLQAMQNVPKWGTQPLAFFSATTWQRGGVLVGPHDSLNSQLRDQLAQALDQFCNDYLSAKEEIEGAKKEESRRAKKK